MASGMLTGVPYNLQGGGAVRMQPYDTGVAHGYGSDRLPTYDFSNAGSSYPTVRAPTIAGANTRTIGYSGKSSGTGGGGVGDISPYLKQFDLGPVVTDTTTTNKQNRSPETEKIIADYEAEIQRQMAGQQSAYENLAGQYDNRMSYLQDAMQRQGSMAAKAAGLTGAAQGLTPIEMQGAANQQWMSALQQMYPQLAQMSFEKAGVPIQMWDKLLGIQTSSALPFAQNVSTPYWNNVAGQVQNVNEVLNNPYLGAQLAQQMKAAEDQIAAQKWEAELQAQLTGQNNANQLAMQQAQLDMQAQIANQQAALSGRGGGGGRITPPERMSPEGLKMLQGIGSLGSGPTPDYHPPVGSSFGVPPENYISTSDLLSQLSNLKR